MILKKGGIAGGTVVRGVAGFTQEKGISSTSLVDTGSGLLPLVVEFLETEKKVEKILPLVINMVGNRLISVCDAEILHGGSFR